MSKIKVKEIRAFLTPPHNVKHLTRWIILQRGAELIFTTWNLIYTDCIRAVWKCVHFVFISFICTLRLYRYSVKICYKSPDPTPLWGLTPLPFMGLRDDLIMRTHDVIVSKPTLKHSLNRLHNHNSDMCFSYKYF